MAKPNHHEQRRFPRVAIATDIAEARGELKALITWPNLEVSSLTDLSYKGMAARRPGLFPFAAQQVVDLHMALGIQPSFRVQTRIVWFDLEAVGLEFKQLPPEGHLAMTEYLDARLLGASLRQVQTALIDSSNSFDFWLQGPSGTDVFVWMKSPMIIEQVHVHLDEVSVHLEREKKLTKIGSAERKALLILSQMDKPDLPMEEFVRSCL